MTKPRDYQHYVTISKRAVKEAGYNQNMSEALISPEKYQAFKATYESKVEALHFAAIFRTELQNRLGWKDPIITNSYLPSFNNAIEMAEAGELKTESLDGVFDQYITRITEKGKGFGYLFRIVVFTEYDIAYFYGQDYVGDELTFYAAKDKSGWKKFVTEVKEKYKGWTKKENEGKITIYTVENGNPRIQKVKFTPIDKTKMVCDSKMLADIETDLTTFFVDKTLYEEFDIAHRRGLMFEGPPGCGKTLMCKYIATITNVPVVQFFASAGCDTPDLMRFFEYMADISPAVVIFEDLDSLFKGDMARSNFLNIIDGACTDKNLDMLIIATTNHVKEIDEAMTQRPSRFDRMYKFDYPNPELRRAYVMTRFANVKSLVEDAELVDVFVKETDRMSYAHLNEIYTQAALMAIQHNKKKLTIVDIETAIKNVKNETTKKGKEIGIKSETLAPLSSRRNAPYEED